MKNSQFNVELMQAGVVVVPVAGCYTRPWPGHVVGGLLVAPTAELRVEQSSVATAAAPTAVMTAVKTSAVDASPRKDAFARSGIRTEGPPV